MLLVVLTMTAALGAAPQQPPASGHTMASDTKPATLLAGIQGVNFPITTRREEAQKFFNQGMALVYAFNHDEAIRSFRRAAEIDPQSLYPAGFDLAGDPREFGPPDLRPAELADRPPVEVAQ